MKSTLPTLYGGLTRCPYPTLFLLVSALLLSACNHYSEQQSLFLKKEQNYYTAEAVEYELALPDRRTETLLENRDIGGGLPIISNLLIDSLTSTTKVEKDELDKREMTRTLKKLSLSQKSSQADKTTETIKENTFSLTAIQSAFSNLLLASLKEPVKAFFDKHLAHSEFPDALVLLANTYAESASGNVNGNASDATGAPDMTAPEIGSSAGYLVLTLPDELPIGTDYTIHIAGDNEAVTAEVWEAPEGTTLPTSTTPTGFTQNGTAAGISNTYTTVSKTTQVATKFLYFKRGSGDILIDAVEYCLTTSSCTNTVDGEVFRDFNGNGTRDTNEPLIPSITVTLYDSLGNTCGSAVTTTTGYSITKTCMGPVRVEFSIPADGECADSDIDFSALSGSAYGSAIQFLDSCGTANYAIQAPEDFNCGVNDDLLVYIPCYLQGDPLNPVDANDLGNLDWFVGYKYSDSLIAGTDFTPQKINGTLIGATWGTAYSRQANTLFTSAFMRRHVGFGQLGSGGIYEIDPTTFTPSSFYDMDSNGHRTRASASAPNYGEGTSFNIATDNGTITYLGSNDPLTGEPAGLGVIGSNDTDRGLPKDVADPSYDPAAFDQVGKVSLGGLEISEDGQYLFVMNLYSRKVFRLELNDVNNPTSVVAVDSVAIPDPSCSDGTYRPFALKYYRGKLYAGVVCSGENGGENIVDGATDLFALVYELDDPKGALSFNTTPILNEALNYQKGERVGNTNIPWAPWNNNASADADITGPMLTDLEFTENGDLVLAFTDRTSMQWGWNNYKFLKTNTSDISQQAAGDLLIAGKNCTTGAFSLENDGVYTSANGTTYTNDPDNDDGEQGPGGEEFFNDRGTRLNNGAESTHQESSLGSAASVYGLGEIYTTMSDPIVIGSDGGAMILSIYDGTYSDDTDLIGLYDDGGSNNLSDNFGKASGLGEIAFTHKTAPIEIGNRVFEDLNGNGIQDAGEPGIDGVVVELISNGVVIATYTTANGGQFYFRNSDVSDPNLNWTGTVANAELQPNTDYTVRISNAEGGAQQTPLDGLSLTTTNANSNGDDRIDNDASIVNTTSAELDVTTGDWGAVDHTLDYGFREPMNTASLGNYVWIDENSDGMQDEGEAGIPNVLVILKDGNGDPIDSTFTDAQGGYLFPDLEAGDYFVDVDETTIPDGMTQTTIFTNNMVDGNDDDTVNDDGDLGNQDHSGNGYAVTLDVGEENLTADFGYNYNPTEDVNNPMGSPVAALGDRVWIDSDGDGIQDPSEVGVEGVIITIFGDPDGDGIFQEIAMDTTDANGNYLFDGLVPGPYFTEVTGTTDEASHDIENTTNYAQTGDPDDFGEPAADPDGKQTEPVVLGPGDVFLNADYGYQPTPANMELGSIGNTIWFDADADGNGPADSDLAGNGDGANGSGMVADADANEEPIAGVSVSLIADTNGDGIWDPLGADGISGTADDEPIIASDVTDENGNYLFEDLPLDDGGGDMDADYIVWVNDSDNVLQGLENTFDEDGGVGTDATGAGDDADMVGGMSATTLSSGGIIDDRNQDFGYTPAGHEEGDGYIGNYVWFDTDGNDPGGQSDADADMDSGIEGVKIYLYDLGADGMIGGGDDVLIDSTLTDENGFYFFGGLSVDDGEGDMDAEYQVVVAPDNFTMGGVIEGMENSYDPDTGVTSPDNSGGVVVLSADMGSGENGNLDQDFGYTGDSANTLGSIGNTIWEDTDADGVYEPDGQDGMASTDDDEIPLAGVTVDLYRDLNGDGEINPGEPKIGTMTTDANGMYLFDNLPLGDYIVDVTDEDGVLNGYWHSTGSQDASTNGGDDPMDNSKEDAFAVTIDNTTPDNLNVDFGYYKEPAAVGNYVWLDVNGNGLQDDDETGINDIVVTMTIMYPDGTTITLMDTTRDDASGNPGFYTFPNLLLDEDYRTGAGMQGDDPTTTDPATAGLPKFVISVDTNQDLISGNNGAPTIANVNGNGNDLEDSDDFDGVLAIPVQGSQNTSAQDPETNETNPIASYDFGIQEIKLGAIGNYIWVDEDSDGLQDEGERGIPNVRVILKDGMGNPLDTTYTDSDGKYLFPNLMMGDYFVDVDEGTLPMGMSQTTTFTNNVDGDDADMVTDDGDLGNKDHSGDGYPITLDNGEENLTADFGYNFNPTDDVNNPMGSPTAALGDRIWIDSDGDGVQDANEVGVSGAEVTLTGPGADGILGTADDVIQTTTTDENGYYLFDALTPGAYVTEVTDDTNASHEILGADYEQTGDPDHFATSEADNPDDTVEDDNKVTKPIVLGPGDVYLNADYGYQPQMGAPVGSIGNTIWFDTDADGNGPADSDPIGDGDNGTGVENDDERPIEGVSVALIADTNGNGIWDDGEDIIATDVTDSNGNYLFEGLPLDDGGGDMDADYIVWLNDTDNVLGGLESTFDEDNQAADVPDATGLGDNAANVGGMSAVALDTGTPDDRDQDFGYTPAGHDSDEGYIGNYVWFDTDGNDAGGQADAEADSDSGIEGVIMELIYVRTGAMVSSTITDENGFYFFGNLPVDLDGEEYQVRVSPDNFLPGGALEGLESTFEPDGDNDNEGDPVLLTTANPGNLDQDFGYTGDDANTLGSIGNTIWEDTDADGVYEPDGQDGTASTSDDETPLEGITVDLYRDLNGDGIINPGEPKYGTMTTDANGMYLFENLPLGDYIVDVTDEAGILNGYWHSTASQDASTNAGNDPMDNSKEDAFAVTIDDTTPDNLNVDFGYYKEPAAVGNYVFVDNNANGLQDAGDTPIEGVVVQMDITYPDGTMVTLTDTTDANGFYEFPNLLLDEDYALGAGTGADGEDPSGVSSSGTQTPKYVISVDPNQAVFTDNNLSPTTADATSDMNDPLNDSEEFSGVVAIPVQGSQNTMAATNATDASGSSNEAMEAAYDFGVAPALDLATNIMISSMTPPQGYYDEDDPIEFMVNVFNQGAVPVSDVTITNYLPSELENAALVASSLMINGMPAPAGVTITKVGNDYVIDFGTNSNNWFMPDDELSFKFTADITDGTSPNTEITNTVEISSYDTDNDTNTAPPADIDSVADNNNGGDGETLGTGLEDDVVDEDVNNNVGDDSDDHDIAIIEVPLVLPVELLGFEAKADKDHIDLVWSTASELNNSHFELERSEDGKIFKQIGKVEGQGTTLETTDYAYEDENIIPGVRYYYRLKQVDLDGSFEYSEVRTANLEVLEGEMEVYPNPIGDATELQVRFYTTELTKEFVILDIHNRSVLQVKQELKNIGWNTMSIDIQVLPAGTYILLDKQGSSKRFVKTLE